MRQTLIALTGGAIAQRLAQFVTTVVIARTLSLATLGEFAVGVNVGALLAMLIDSGVRSVTAREAARADRDKALVWLHASIRPRLVFAVTVYLAFVAVVVGCGCDNLAFWFVCGALVFPAVYDLKGISESLGVTGFEVRVESAASIGYFAGVSVLAAVGGLGLTSLAVLMLVSRLAYSAAAIRWLRHNPAPAGVPRPRHLLRRGGPLSIVQFLNRAVYSADVLLIRWLAGSEAAVGLYYVAARVAHAAQIPLSMLARLFQPHLQHAAERGDQSATLERVVRSSAYLIVPVAVGGLVLAHDLLVALYGVPFGDATQTLRYLLLAAVFVGVGSLYGNLLFARREHGAYVATILLGTATNATLSLLWIPEFGAAGSACASAAATFAASALSCALLHRRMAFDVLAPFLRPLGLSAVVVGAVLCLPDSVHALIRILIGGVVYGFGLWQLELRGGWLRVGAGLQRSSGFERGPGVQVPPPPLSVDSIAAIVAEESRDGDLERQRS